MPLVEGSAKLLTVGVPEPESFQREAIMSKSKKSKPTKKPLTFIVLQGVSPALKKAWFAKAKRKEMTFSAWAREALGAAR